MGTKRSKALHNFTMPCDLQWGNQRHLRCMNLVNSNGGQISPANGLSAANSSDHRGYNRFHHRRTVKEMEEDGLCGGSFKESPPTQDCEEDGRWINDGGGVGIGSTREKVIFDLQTAAGKMKDAIFKGGVDVEGKKVNASVSVSPPPPQQQQQLPIAEGNTYCPWNLRTRRASCAATVSDRRDVTPFSSAADGKGFKTDAHSRIPQIRVSSALTTAPISRSNGADTVANGEKSGRPKFSVPLGKKEIEEDFLAMVGRRPPRRPKKRPRVVQRQMDTLFPGFWLTEVTPDMYKVAETAP